MKFSINNDYTNTPGGRLRESSKWSAQELAEDHLYKILDDIGDDYLLLDLDYTYGLPRSFIDEICLRLVNRYGSTFIVNKVYFKSHESACYIRDFYESIKEASEIFKK